MIRRESKTPIIMLTALDEEEAQVKAFELKVDDYITKPFSVRLVRMRVEAVLRRVQERENKELADVLSWGEYPAGAKQPFRYRKWKSCRPYEHRVRAIGAVPASSGTGIYAGQSPQSGMGI